LVYEVETTGKGAKFNTIELKVCSTPKSRAEMKIANTPSLAFKLQSTKLPFVG